MTAEQLELLGGTRLFEGIGRDELARLLAHLGPAVQRVPKGGQLLGAGEAALHIGVVLAGDIEALKYTAGGDEFSVARMGPGGVYGDVLSGSHSKSPVCVVARSATTVLLIPYQSLFRPAAGEVGEPLRRLLANLLAVISDKYFALDKRVDLLLVKGLRARVADFLLDEARRCGAGSFTVPYTRAQLAAYLGCERSALSRELSRMAADGLIEVRRSQFRILDDTRMAAGPGGG